MNIACLVLLLLHGLIPQILLGTKTSGSVITVVQGCFGENTNPSITCVFSSPVTTGNAIVCGLAIGGSPTITLADSQSNTYTAPSGTGSTYDANSGYTTYMGKSISVTGGSTFTVTPTAAGGNYTRIGCAEISGATAIDGNGATGNGLGTALASGTWTGTNASLIVGWGFTTANPITAGLSFSPVSSASDAYAMLETGTLSGTSPNALEVGGGTAYWDMVGLTVKH